MTEPDRADGDMRWEVVLEPAVGDGRLTVCDLDRATRRLPQGVDVVLLLCEVVDFDAGAVSDLGRRLVGSRVTFTVRNSSFSAARAFRDTVRRARSQYLDVEAERLTGWHG